jgi:hypothetical protein
MPELKLRPPKRKPKSGPPHKDLPYTGKRKVRTDPARRVGHYKIKRKAAGLEDSPCATRAGLMPSAYIK